MKRGVDIVLGGGGGGGGGSAGRVWMRMRREREKEGFEWCIGLVGGKEPRRKIVLFSPTLYMYIYQ